MLINGAVTKIRIITIFNPQRTKTLENNIQDCHPYFKLKILFGLFHFHTLSKSNRFSLFPSPFAFLPAVHIFFSHSGPNGPTCTCTMLIAASGRNAVLTTTRLALAPVAGGIFYYHVLLGAHFLYPPLVGWVVSYWECKIRFCTRGN